MAHSSATKMTWSCLNTKEDLFNTFLGCVDKEVIELVIENRNNNLLLAYRDLEEITNTPNSDQSFHLSFEEKKQTVMPTDSNIPSTIDWEHLSKNEIPTNRILYLVSRGYKVMVLMRGCPGSGKSYQATNILGQCYENTNVNEFIFSTDNFFINKHTGRYCFNRSKLNIAHQWTYENVQKAVQNEVTPVIIDNTNTEAWEMEVYVKLGVNNGYWIEIIEPNSEWAWNEEELFKKNVHNVPYINIISMLQRYDHRINVDNLLSRFKLKYNKKNQPPQLSKSSKKYQLCKHFMNDLKVKNKAQVELDHFKELHISENQYNDKNQSEIFNNIEEDLCANIIREKEVKSIVDKRINLYHNNSDEDNQSISSNEEASNYINKSVNTDENDFLFMGVLNEIPEEEYRPYVIFGTNRDINEGNQSILNIPCEKLDKGTTTHDLLKITSKLNLNELHKQFPENVCSLISELFDECEGNIEWIIDMLVESGYNISKQQLLNVILHEENSLTESIPAQINCVNNLKQNKLQNYQDDNVAITSQNVVSETVTFNENKIIEETDSKKKKRRKKLIRNDLKGSNSQLSDTNLRKNIENKFVFGDSLYSDHVLKIKKLKENNSIIDDDNVKLGSINNDLKSLKNDSEYVQLVMDTSVLTQLCDYFGDFSSDLNKSTLPMSVKLPEKLAEDLYYCLIANVPTDIFNQEAILQDEFLARKLQEECKKECSSNISNSHTGELTFAAVLSKKLLLEKFKNLDSKTVLNVLRDNNYKFQEASDVLSNLSGIKCSTNQVDSNIEENENPYPNDVEQKSTNYQQEALEHAHTRQQFINKANQSLSSKKHPAVTAYYLDKAEEYKQNEKYAKTNAFTNMIIQNENATTLDLHFLPVTDALLVLDLYLDTHISNLKKFSERYSRGRHLTIITGRGKHSPKGIARIKPVVVRRLQDRQLMYFESEETPGLIMVIIKKNSLLSL